MVNKDLPQLLTSAGLGVISVSCMIGFFPDGLSSPFFPRFTYFTFLFLSSIFLLFSLKWAILTYLVGFVSVVILEVIPDTYKLTPVLPSGLMIAVVEAVVYATPWIIFYFFYRRQGRSLQCGKHASISRRN